MPRIDIQTLSFIAALGCMLLVLRFWFVSRRLEDSEQRYGVIFQGTNEVMLVIDSETGAILEANAAALHFYGYERARMLRLAGAVAPDPVVDAVTLSRARSESAGASHNALGRRA